MNFYTILFIAILLVSADKIITVMNIKAVEKNYPTNSTDAISIEKNPIAKDMFKRFGLYGGTLIYWFFSILTFLAAVFFMHYPAKLYAPENSYGVALYIVMLLYSIVLMNNFYFLLRYNKLL
jgi:hypothetical protein